MRKTIVVILLLVVSITSLAQVNEGGIPPSFRAVVPKLQQSPQALNIRLDIDIAVLRKEDALIIDKSVPSRVAVLTAVEKDLAKDGEWTTLDSGEKICRLAIKSEGALGIVLYYSKFVIPYGGKLFIYDKDKIQLLGAYTHRTNLRGAEFVTEMVYGDELVLEYVSPKGDRAEKPQIIISELAHAYNQVEGYGYEKALPDSTGFLGSGSCQVNINCTEGQSWQRQKKGVARTYTKIGSYMYRCSGSLVNNTNNDKRAFYLSAYHCFYQGRYAANFNTILFYFDYEFSGCLNEEYTPVDTKTVVGAQLLIASPIDEGSDGALLELLDPIPDDYDVYFNGWDISNNTSNMGVCIHHPQGDVKKISTYTTEITTGSYADTDDSSAEDAHWVVRFAQTTNGFGTTEGGSSGSPLFNGEGNIIGALTGGTSGCSNQSGKDYFGKIFYHYNQHTDTPYHMQPYLNPTGAVMTKLNGIPNLNIPPVEGENIKFVYAYWNENTGLHHSTLVVRTKDEANEINRIRITNFRGYVVVDKSAGFAYPFYDEIDANAWARGLYIVTVETQNGKRSFKLIK